MAPAFGDLEESERESLECIDKVKVIAIEDADLNARTDLPEEFDGHINKKVIKKNC